MSTYTYPTVAINTYLTFTAKRWGQFPTITFSNGAVAGSEVASVDASNNISVQIESGVSTNAMIKAAVETHSVTTGLSANDLVSVAVTAGHNSDTQVSCVNATLANGLSTAVKASKVIAGLKYEAQTAGVAGNSIRVKYTSGGSLSVSVSTNDITVQLKNDGTSTNTLIIAAVVAYGPSNALVSVVSSGEATSRVPTTDAAPDFVALAGGLDAAVASVVVQDLTIASDSSVSGSVDNGRKLTYTTGATAGAEVVSGTADISVQIQSGTSTATQVKAALDAYVPFNGVAASGTATISSYAAMHLTAAVPSGTITFGSPSDNSTIVLTGLPTDGTKTFTKKTAVSAVKAAGTITYGSPDVLTKASGTVTIADWTKASALQAVGTVTVANFALLHKQKALKVIQDLTYTAVAYGVGGNSISVEYVSDIAGDYAIVEVPTADTILVHMDATAVTGTTANTIKAAVNTDPQASLLVLVSGASANIQAVQAPTNLADGQDAATVSVNGIVLTETADWLATVSNNSTAASIAAAITTATATTLCTAAAVATDIVTITANAYGLSGNSLTLATSDAGNLLKSGATLADGRVATTVTVAGHALVANVDWTAATNNDTTADNLAAAIDSLSEVSAANPAAAVITVLAASGGTAGNSIATVTSYAAAASVQQALLSGGLAASTVTVDGTIFTCVASGPGAGEFSAIAELTTLVNALSNVDATDNGTVVAVEAAVAGTAGNSIVMSKTGAGLTLVQLSGGVNAYVLGATEFGVIADLTALIQALTDLNASDNGSVVTITVATKGTAMNAATITGTSSYSALSRTFSGGINATTVTVGTTTLVESTDFNAVSSNDQTATNLAAAIDSLALVGASATLAVVTILADATGTAGNLIALAKAGSGVAVSGAYLSGGTDGLACSISGSAGTAQKTVNGASMTGAVAPNVLGFFVDNSITALTSSYVYFPFAVRYNNVVLNNDETTGNKQVIFSWDGINNHGILDPGESVNLVNANRSSIFLKYGNAAPVYRVFGSGTF